jgi:hypothetical protein
MATSQIIKENIQEKKNLMRERIVTKEDQSQDPFLGRGQDLDLLKDIIRKIFIILVLEKTLQEKDLGLDPNLLINLIQDRPHLHIKQSKDHQKINI